LVLNPSFETFTACPTSGGNLYNATNWDNAKNTPDYFNNCAPNNIPSNFFGYQNPAHGNAYAGFYTNDPSTPQYREIIIGKLSSPTTIGQKYFVSFLVSRGDAPLIVEASTNKIGARFTKTKYNLVFPNLSNALMDDFAHIYTNNVIMDTLNWTKISGSFIADSAYQYIMIGNFFTPANTTVVYDAGNNTMSYYYIDQVCTSTDSLFAETYTPTALINNYLENDLKLFPNPANNYFIVNGIQTGNLKIYDTNGGLVINKKINNNEPINTADLKDGIYWICIANKKTKIIINH
jgi:hypothetical protein